MNNDSGVVRVLYVSPSFYPAVAYGGPIFSTKAITDGIAGSAGFSIEVLSTDTANPNNKMRLSLPENPMTLPPGYQVHYCRSLAGTSISPTLLWRMVKRIRQADVVHLTGPYNFPVIPTLIITRVFRKPLVWSPRGGFQATAQWMGAPKRRIKTAFEKICAFLAPRDMTFHVTAEEEAETCSRCFPKVPCEIIPNAVEVPQSPPVREADYSKRLRLAFLSRIHPKKGLDIMLPALARLPSHVTLEIYGEGAPEYIKTLEADIERLGLKERVAFGGHVSGEEKAGALSNCDIFVLPTHSENFGIVVAEALAYGTPVITTKKAPWSDLEKQDCGLWIDDSVEALTDAVLRMEVADLATMGSNGHRWMAREFSTEPMVRRFVELYAKVVNVNELAEQ